MGSGGGVHGERDGHLHRRRGRRARSRATPSWPRSSTRSARSTSSPQPTTACEIVEENLDECVLCYLCVEAAPEGTVRVIKLYDGGALLERG